MFVAKLDHYELKAPCRLHTAYSIKLEVIYQLSQSKEMPNRDYLMKVLKDIEIYGEKKNKRAIL